MYADPEGSKGQCSRLEKDKATLETECATQTHFQYCAEGRQLLPDLIVTKQVNIEEGDVEVEETPVPLNEFQTSVLTFIKLQTEHMNVQALAQAALKGAIDAPRSWCEETPESLPTEEQSTPVGSGPQVLSAVSVEQGSVTPADPLVTAVPTFSMIGNVTKSDLAFMSAEQHQKDGRFAGRLAKPMKIGSTQAHVPSMNGFRMGMRLILGKAATAEFMATKEFGSLVFTSGCKQTTADMPV